MSSNYIIKDVNTMLEQTKGEMKDGVVKIGEDDRKMTDGVEREESGYSG